MVLQAKSNKLITEVAGNLLSWRRLVGSNAEGRGIGIAIVDSGLNPWHSHIGEVSGGVAIKLEESRLVWNSDFQDFLGHGTAIAGIIRAKAPAVKLYGVRIFESSLNTYPTVATAGIKWAADRGIAIINLSFGTINSHYTPILQEACDYAASCGCIIIAAAGTAKIPGWPAALECVMGVKAGSQCEWDDYIFQPGNQVEFTAHGFPRSLAGRPQSLNLQGNSFATAHLSALAACLREQNPAMDGEGFRRLLQIGINKGG